MSFSTTSRGASSFDDTLAPFFHADGLPFADVRTADDIAQAFAEEHVSFGKTPHSFWTPALTLWTFLSQVLGGNKSCRAAVARAFVAAALSRPVQDWDTGNYCRARGKLPTPVLRRLTLQIGTALEAEAPAAWRWHGRRVLLGDGFTTTLPDTTANQRAYPQPNTQKPGLGFPLLRVLVLLSLATAAVQGLALGPYQGKESGEPSLFRTLLSQLAPGTIVLADRFFCSYFMVVLLQARGLEGVFRRHRGWTAGLRRVRGLGGDDDLMVWPRPDRPAWMDAATYAALPESIPIRMVRQAITQRGYRVRSVTVLTTLLDAAVYARAEVADLYHKRWHVELDIRAIKATLQMDTLRCRSPEMVEKEIWAHFLGYNLIRKAAAQAAVLREMCPREVSFAATQQGVLASWSKLTEASTAERALLARRLLEGLGKERVGQRPNRCEPRAVKRRPKKQKLLTKPRAQARAELLAGQGTGDGD
jgi:putative transposase